MPRWRRLAQNGSASGVWPSGPLVLWQQAAVHATEHTNLNQRDGTKIVTTFRRFSCVWGYKGVFPKLIFCPRTWLRVVNNRLQISDFVTRSVGGVPQSNSVSRLVGGFQGSNFILFHGWLAVPSFQFGFKGSWRLSGFRFCQPVG